MHTQLAAGFEAHSVWNMNQQSTRYQVAPAAEPVNRIMQHRPASLAMNAIHPDHEELSTSTEPAPVASCGQQELTTDEAMHDFVDKLLS